MNNYYIKQMKLRVDRLVDKVPKTDGKAYLI